MALAHFPNFFYFHVLENHPARGAESHSGVTHISDSLIQYPDSTQILRYYDLGIRCLLCQHLKLILERADN